MKSVMYKRPVAFLKINRKGLRVALLFRFCFLINLRMLRIWVYVQTNPSNKQVSVIHAGKI